MICPNCGTENRPDARFCAHCGFPLAPGGAERTPVPPPAPPQMSAMAAPPPPEPAPWGPPYAGGRAAPAGPVSVPRRFPILRILSVIYKVLGGIAAAITVLTTIGICVLFTAGGGMLEGLERELGTPVPMVSGVVGGILFGLMALIYGGFIALFLFATGEAIALLLALEENTRAIIASLR